MSSMSDTASGASPRSGRRIKGPFFRPSGVRSSSKRASLVLLSQKRNLESASGMMSEALYTSPPFNSPNGMESIVIVSDLSWAEFDKPFALDLPTPGRFVFEHPVAYAAQSAISNPLARRAATALIVLWCDSFKRTPQSTERSGCAPLPSVFCGDLCDQCSNVSWSDCY